MKEEIVGKIVEELKQQGYTSVLKTDLWIERNDEGKKCAKCGKVSKYIVLDTETELYLCPACAARGLRRVAAGIEAAVREVSGQ